MQNLILDEIINKNHNVDNLLKAIKESQKVDYSKIPVVIGGPSSDDDIDYKAKLIDSGFFTDPYSVNKLQYVGKENQKKLLDLFDEYKDLKSEISGRMSANGSIPSKDDILAVMDIRDRSIAFDRNIVEPEARANGYAEIRELKLAFEFRKQLSDDIYELLNNFYPEPLEVEVDGKRKGLVSLLYDYKDNSSFFQQFTLVLPTALTFNFIDDIKDVHPNEQMNFIKLTDDEISQFGSKYVEIRDESGSRGVVKSELLITSFWSEYKPFDRFNNLTTPDSKPIKLLSKSDTLTSGAGGANSPVTNIKFEDVIGSYATGKLGNLKSDEQQELRKLVVEYLLLVSDLSEKEDLEICQPLELGSQFM